MFSLFLNCKLCALLCYILQFSDEEVEDMQCPWENPLFENTDQLMDERSQT